MDKSIKKCLITRLKQYRYIDKIINQRINMIEHPYDESMDDNVGGGKKQNSNDLTVERNAIKEADDYLLNDLKNHRKIISDKLRETDEITRAIIEDRYTKHGYSKVETALRQHVSEPTVYTHTLKFLEELEPILLPIEAV